MHKTYIKDELINNITKILVSEIFNHHKIHYDRRPLIEASNSISEPKFRVIDSKIIEVLKRIPCYNEGFSIDPLIDIAESSISKTEIFMISHRWLQSGNLYKKQKPDNEQNEKASAINEFTKWRKSWVSSRHSFTPDIFYWIDYSCIDQENSSLAIPFLPLWVACCERFLRIDSPEYNSRTWCRFESFLSYHFSFADHHMVINTQFKSKWPHTGDEKHIEILDPLAGEITNKQDLNYIKIITNTFTAPGYKKFNLNKSNSTDNNCIKGFFL